MKQLCNYNPRFFGTDAVNIMVIHDWDSFDVYYQIAGSPFTFAFGIPDSEGFMRLGNWQLPTLTIMWRCFSNDFT